LLTNSRILESLVNYEMLESLIHFILSKSVVGSNRLELSLYFGFSFDLSLGTTSKNVFLILVLVFNIDYSICRTSFMGIKSSFSITNFHINFPILVGGLGTTSNFESASLHVVESFFSVALLGYPNTNIPSLFYFSF
jgi:hypothetical protein